MEKMTETEKAAKKALIDDTADAVLSFLSKSQPEDGQTLGELSDVFAEMYCDINAVIFKVLKNTAANTKKQGASLEDTTDFAVTTLAKCLDMTTALVAPHVMGTEVMSLAADRMIAVRREQLKESIKSKAFADNFDIHPKRSFSETINSIKKRTH